MRKSAADFYKMKVSKEAPVLKKFFTTTNQTANHRGLSRDDELVNYLEHTSPIDMLRDINDKEPLPVDVQLAERLVHTYGLPVGVVNVLFQYVSLRNDGKITNNYVERIASHWRGKDVQTARQAMEFSRKEHDQYMKWKNEGQKPAVRKRSNAREEKVPEWFYKKDDEQPVKSSKPNSDVDEERRKLLEELGVTKSEVR